MDINTIILIIIFILLIAGIPFCFFLVGYKLTQFNKECEKAKIRALDTFNKNKGKIAKQIDNQIKELGGKKQMQIDEFEFRDKNGNEIEPTKNQLVIYIKSLHKQIKDLKTQPTVKDKALQLAVEIFCTGSHQDMKLAIKNMAFVSGIIKYIKEQAERELEEDKNGK